MKDVNEIHGLTMEQWIVLREFVREGLSPVYTSADVAMVMDEFAQKFDIVAMYDFFLWAKKENKDNQWILSNICHDLGGRNDTCFAPRTESYRGINEDVE